MSNKPRILVLDDDEAIRNLLDKTLTQVGFEVQTHSELDGKLNESYEDHFDLIVTNYVMNGHKGLSFVRNLRENGKEVPVVMITGTFYPGVFFTAKKIGVDYVMAKPIHKETLLQVVHRLLRQSQGNSVFGGRRTSAQKALVASA